MSRNSTVLREEKMEGEYRKKSFPGSSAGKESACHAEDLISFLSQGDPLGKEITTHCSMLAWEIPWREEPGRLQPMELQRVRPNGVTFTYVMLLEGLSA